DSPPAGAVPLSAGALSPPAGAVSPLPAGAASLCAAPTSFGAGALGRCSSDGAPRTGPGYGVERGVDGGSSPVSDWGAGCGSAGREGRSGGLIGGRNGGAGRVDMDAQLVTGCSDCAVPSPARTTV